MIICKMLISYIRLDHIILYSINYSTNCVCVCMCDVRMPEVHTHIGKSAPLSSQVYQPLELKSVKLLAELIIPVLYLTKKASNLN